MIVGIGCVLVSGILGTLIGLVSGFYGGLIGALLMRIADIKLAMPMILFAIASKIKGKIAVIVSITKVVHTLNVCCSYAGLMKKNIMKSHPIFGK